jgi:hypothetical protein
MRIDLANRINAAAAQLSELGHVDDPGFAKAQDQSYVRHSNAIEGDAEPPRHHEPKLPATASKAR